MGKKYERKCDYCNKLYKREGRFFCSQKCSHRYRAEYKPEWRLRLSISGKKRWTKKEKQKQSERLKGRIAWNKGKKCPSISKGLLGNIPWNKGISRTTEDRLKISNAVKKSGRSKGKNNAQWKGGISKNPYDSELTKFNKYLIFKRDKFTCKECLKYPVKKITVHHIDYNKTNSKKDNLITLCHSCNCKANFNRDYWKKRFNKLLKV